MGMFDSIMVRATCPYCSCENMFEAQTKELSNSLSVYWSVPNYFFDEEASFPNEEYKAAHMAMAKVSGDRKRVHATFTCPSPYCSLYSMMEDYKEHGYYSGLSRMFTADIVVRDGFLTEELLNVELVTPHSDGCCASSSRLRLLSERREVVITSVFSCVDCGSEHEVVLDSSDGLLPIDETVFSCKQEVVNP